MIPDRYIKPDGYIENLQRAIDVLEEIKSDTRFLRTERRQGIQDQFPFGIWFRGQARSWPLQPKVFRTRPNQLHDEANIFAHCQIRLPDYHNRCRTKFDWLCLMQHYGVPSRLLDWSESLLIALYFAVAVDDNAVATTTENPPQSESAYLIALNARRLNSHAYHTPVPDKYGLFIPSSFEVIVRAEMAAKHSRSALVATLFGGESGSPEATLRAKLELSGLTPEIKKKGDELLFANFNLCQPVAVAPNRINERMVFQSSAFTIHGGKMYLETDKTEPGDKLESPDSLEEINQKDKILKYYEIPRDCIVRIREQLFELGIHEGSLFPEIDKQGNYLRQIW